MKFKNYITQIFLTILIAITTLQISTKYIDKNPNIDLGDIYKYIIPILILYFFNNLYTKCNIYFFNKNWFFSIFTKGYYVIISALIFFVLSMQDFNKQLELNNIIIFFISCLLTATFEELAFRGIIQNKLKNKLNDNFKAIIITSILFSITHILNLITKPYLIIATISQVGYTFALGFLLAVIYHTTKSLSTVIALHTIFNFLGSFILLYDTNTINSTPTDSNIISLIIQWIVIAPCIFIGLKIYNKNNDLK